MMASLGGDVKPLALSHSSFFHQSKLKGRLKNPNTVRKGWGTFPRWQRYWGGGEGERGSYSKLINGLMRLPVTLFMLKSELTVHMIICKKERVFLSFNPRHDITLHIFRITSDGAIKTFNLTNLWKEGLVWLESKLLIEQH